MIAKKIDKSVDAVNTPNLMCDFGKHAGTLYTRIPISYLRWMVQVGHSKKDIAEAELKRRGCVDLPSLEISNHAIDRASFRCWSKWIKERKTDEGLHAWLMRFCTEALSDVILEDTEDLKVNHSGIKLVFSVQGSWPVLKTLMRCKND